LRRDVRLPGAVPIVLEAVEEAYSNQVDVVRGQRRWSVVGHSTLIEREALRQHQPPTMCGGGGRVLPALLLRGGMVSGRQWMWYEQLIPGWVPCCSVAERAVCQRKQRISHLATL